MTRPRAALGFLAEDDFRAAALPLFESGLVEALERDIDAAWGETPDGEASRPQPAWANEIFDHYAREDALYGHGVWLSLLSGCWTARHERWIEQLAAECATRHYRHVSEHFGWMTAGAYWHNTMYPLPRTARATELGRERLQRIAAATRGPVGLENLAAALAPADALEQGAFLEDILRAADGFLLLDLHNVWSQAVNLDLDPARLLDAMPLGRVRELHVSGGDWHVVEGQRAVRFDSHDHGVPDEVWQLLRDSLPRCPGVEVVVFERRGDSLRDPEARQEYRDDFHRLCETIA